MSNRVSMALKVFRIELEDSEDDVMVLLEYYSKRFENHEITPYVWRENQALLKKELSCVKELEKEVASWAVPENTDPEDVLELLKNHLKELVTQRGYPELVNLVIDKISAKVKRYLE